MTRRVSLPNANADLSTSQLISFSLAESIIVCFSCLMANNRKTADDMAAKFTELLETAKSTDDLRQQGVPERMIETFEAIMRREGLDPERPADLRVMLGRMIDTAYQRLMN